MDPKAIVDALEKQMDRLESIFKWVAIFTVPIFWAGLNRNAEVEALGITFNLTQAYYLLVIVYFFTSFQIYMSLQRIENYLFILEDENVKTGISNLVFHGWILNPFIYTGDDKRSRKHLLLANAGLITAYMAGNAALYTLSTSEVRYAGIIFWGLNFFAVFTSLSSIRNVTYMILAKLERVDQTFFSKYKATLRFRNYGTIAGIVVGGLLYAAVGIADALMH